MLTSLTIRDFVLIKNLTVSFASGLAIMTGETGGGKSILLDALNLALGGRGDSSIISNPAKQASISAEFSLSPNHKSFKLAAHQGLSLNPSQGQIILRRIITKEGRSRAFVNDEPVTVGFLKNLGDTLIEIHGQHDDRGLLNPKGHRGLLDAFGGHEGLLSEMAGVYGELSSAQKALEKLKIEQQARHVEEEYDRHCLAELNTLNPIKGEEETLSTRRKLMIEGEKSAEQVAKVLTLLQAGDGVEMTIRSALRRLERLPDELKTPLASAIEALARGANETEEGLAHLHRVSETLVYDQDKLDQTEERLFELRAQARKHKCQVNQLPEILADLK
ncbi:MAG: AAA family ATPase, partial [Sphingomonadales bacterium]